MNSIEIFGKCSPFPRQEFVEAFESFSHEAFRLELLQQFNVAREQESFDDFKKGRPVPKNYNGEWCKTIQKAAERGASFKRVRLITEPLTEYTKFEISWGYKVNTEAGEDIRYISGDILSSFETSVPILKDFWLFDEKLCLLMEYDLLGTYLGVTKLPDEHLGQYIALKREALNKSKPIQEYNFWGWRRCLKHLCW